MEQVRGESEGEEEDGEEGKEGEGLPEEEEKRKEKFLHWILILF